MVEESGERIRYERISVRKRAQEKKILIREHDVNILLSYCPSSCVIPRPFDNLFSLSPSLGCWLRRRIREEYKGHEIVVNLGHHHRTLLSTRIYILSSQITHTLLCAREREASFLKERMRFFTPPSSSSFPEAEAYKQSIILKLAIKKGKAKQAYGASRQASSASSTLLLKKFSETKVFLA